MIPRAIYFGHMCLIGGLDDLCYRLLGIYDLFCLSVLGCGCMHSNDSGLHILTVAVGVNPHISTICT